MRADRSVLSLVELWSPIRKVDKHVKVTRSTIQLISQISNIRAVTAVPKINACLPKIEWSAYQPSLRRS